MTRYFLSIFSVFLLPVISLLPASEDDKKAYETIATLEGVPSAIVGNAVNAITGAYCDCQTDLVVTGAHPIQIQRFYSSDAHTANFTHLTGPLARAQVWHWNHGGLVSVSKTDSKYKACVYKGSSLSGLIYRSLDHDRHELKIRSEFFEHGLTNCHYQEISGRTHHKNTRVFINKSKSCVIRTGAGVETNADPMFSYDHSKYRINSENNPNGNILKYGYQDNDHIDLKKIRAFNHKNDLLGLVSINYPDEKKWKKEPIVIKAQDGRQVSYYFDEGKDIDRRLRWVVRSDAPDEIYHYEHSSRYEERIIRKELPDGRFLSIDYSGKKDPEKGGRVSMLMAPIGQDKTPYILYTFKYHHDHSCIGCGYTNVWDTHGNKKAYVHDTEKRLVAINTFDGEELYRAERYYWGTYDAPIATGRQLIGNLITSLIREGKNGPILSCRNLEYDALGNVLVDRLFGNLTGKNKKEISLNWIGTGIGNCQDEPGDVAIPEENGCNCFKKQCTYSNAPYNLLTSENNGRSIVKYYYEPTSNRLSSKLICDLQEKIKKRHFYSYDQNAVLSQEIIDDGSSIDSHDLLGVTEKKITYYFNTKTMPIGLPKVIQEKYLNFATGQEFLIKKVVKEYSTEGRLLREDHYDSEGCFAYSLSWKYDRMGNVIEETDALGHTTFRKYDDNGNKIFEQKPGLTYFVRNTYDYSNRLVCVEEVHNNGEIYKTTNHYNLLSQCTCTTDYFFNETHHEYDKLGRLVKTIHPYLNSTEDQPYNQFEESKYNVLDQPIEHLDINGHIKKSQFTIRGQPCQVNYPDGSKEQFEYTLDGLLSKQWDADGTLTVYEYDYQGRPITKSLYSAQGTLLYSTTTTYNAFHKLSETDAAGHLTTYAYDSARRISEIRKKTHRTCYLYDPLGCIERTLEYVNKKDFIAKIQGYDLLDRVIAESTEDSLGNLQSKVEYKYDIAGNRTQVIRQVEDKVAINSTEYDSYNRPIVITNAEGHSTHISYHTNHLNALGQYVLRKETTDPLGRMKVEIYNALDHLEEEIRKDSFGKTIQSKFFYRSGNGLLLKQIDKVYVGNVPKHEIITKWIYDSKDRLTDCYEALNTPEQKHTSTRYNNKGQKQTIVKPTGVMIQHEYDDFGRLSRFSASDGSFDYEYLYDLNSNVTSVHDVLNDKTNSRIYDVYDQLVTETLGNDLTIHFTRDRIGRVTKIQLPDGRTGDYNFDGNLLRNISLKDKDEKISFRHTYSAFDLSGNVLSAQLIGKAGALANHYDKLGKTLQTASLHWSESNIIYDALGNLLHREIKDTEGKISCLYKYDSLNQLTSESGIFKQQYGSDSLYNRVEKNGKNHEINSLNQLLNDGEQSLFYDKNGNLIKIAHDSKEVTYNYDALNRLVELTNGKHRYKYTYDSFNRRLSKDAYVIDAKSWRHTQSTLYLYHEQNEIGALENGVFISLRLLGLGKGAEIGAAVAIELNGQFYAPVHDLNGSVVCLLDAVTGGSVATYRYSAFGEEQNFGQVKNQWRYASKRVDPESGFVYFGRRYYAPQFGRWITPDPLDFKDGPNLYAYLHNNPMTYFDEYGLEAAPSGMGTPGSIGFSQSVIANVSSALQTGLDIGAGTLNGFSHPLDTMSSWSGNSQDNSVSVSNATRVGEVCGVGLLLVPTVGGVRVAYGVGKVLLSQSARLLASASRVTRALFAGKVIKQSSNIAVKKSSQTVIKAEASLSANIPMEGVALSRGAENVNAGILLRNKLAAQEIAGGHAFEKHILNQGEFQGWIRTRDQFAQHIEKVLNNSTATKQLINGRTGSWHQETGTVVVRNPSASDGGTAFQALEGIIYFEKKLN